MKKRVVTINRKTKETQINLIINLDGKGIFQGESQIGFLNHMLELFAKHSSIDLSINASGDLQVDQHHLVEDIGIVLGQAILKALGDKKGIARYGFFILPMDESLVLCSLDLGGRAFLNYEINLKKKNLGNMDSELFLEFWTALTNNAKMNLHLIQLKGKNSHHIIEAVFKSFAKALKQAVCIDGKSLPSTKEMM